MLSAQFESFIDPLIIMLTVPLSITGALIALHLTGGTLNVYSQIGLITLVGLITKHGILIVEFANQLQAQGRGKFDAVIEAGLRLRPILMTTGAMVLGAVPLALATGAGAESRSQIGWVIVGGISFGTLFTLFVVPTAYTLLARTRPRRRGSTGSRTRATAAGRGVAPVQARARAPAVRADRLTPWRPERGSLRAAWHETHWLSGIAMSMTGSVKSSLLSPEKLSMSVALPVNRFTR